MKVQVTTVLGVVEHLASFGEDACGEGARRADAAFRGEEIDLIPIFPRLEIFAVDVRREADAVALLEMEPHDQHLRASREIRAVFPERAVRGVVGLSDFDRFDGRRLSDRIR